MQNEHENETVNQNEGQQIQRELEQQLRDFGETVSDAFAHGFEGRGGDIGDKAYGVGRAAVHAANYGINEAAKAFRTSRDEFAADRWADKQNAAAQQSFGDEMNRWARQLFRKKEKPPVELIRTSAKKRHDVGCALLAVGITFAAIFGIGGIGCFAAAASFAPQIGTAIEDVIITADPVTGELIYGTATVTATAVSGMALTGMQVAGGVLSMIAMGFGGMIYAGASRLSAAKKLDLFADAAEGMDAQKGLPLEMLAQLTHQTRKKLKKSLCKFLHKGWLSAWLDEKTDRLYLTAEDYRAAQQEPAEQPETEAPSEKSALNLETARRFAEVLGKEQQLMQDEQAKEELAHMQKTANAICDWMENHPESLPKARRFAEYYIPTTLKLLHTYNDVQGQQGETAETIRRDIAGILHTLNQAYDTLYNTLLSDVAMDVSSEIAALQGMLANDGLTGREFQ